MSFGCPPCHYESVRFDGVCGVALMDRVKEAFHRLGWPGHQCGRWNFRGSAGVGLWSWVNVIAVEVGEGELFVSSECSGPGFDLGRNRGNVGRLLEKLEGLLGVPARGWGEE